MRPVHFFVDLDPKILVWVCPLHFLSVDNTKDRSLVHHQLFGLADTELQVIVGAPCDEALCQSSVLLLIVVVDASNNGGVI